MRLWRQPGAKNASIVGRAFFHSRSAMQAIAESWQSSSGSPPLVQ
jgi:hypothetical protein